MTEAEWLMCSDPRPMLAFLGEGASDRKQRLFAVACCRRIQKLILKSKAGYRAVVLAERSADGQPVTEDVREYRAKVCHEGFSWIDGFRTERENNFMYFAIYAAASSLSGLSTNQNLCESNFPRQRYMFGDYCTLTACDEYASYAVAHWCRRNDKDEVIVPARNREKLEQARLVRDIFGNPFRPHTADVNWLTSTVLDLSSTIYKEKAFDRLPILADALQDVGCDNDDILNHCRGDGLHVRGCWVVDLLLGKE